MSFRRHFPYIRFAHPVGDERMAKRTGDLLLEEGILTAEEIRELIDAGGWKGTPFARALQSAQYVSRRDLAAFLGAEYDLPEIGDLRDLDISRKALKVIPAAVARRHIVLPLGVAGNILCIAALDSVTPDDVSEIRKKCGGFRIKVLVADADQLRAAVSMHYDARKAEIPPPKKRRPETTVSRATPPSTAAESDEGVPLISMPVGPAAVAARADVDVEELELEEIAEVLDAQRVGNEEYVQESRSPAVRLALEFESIHNSGKPVPAIRVS